MISPAKIDFCFSCKTEFANTVPGCHLSLLAAGNMQRTKNLEDIRSFFSAQNISQEKLISAKQIHSKKILYFEKQNDFTPFTEADGVITCNKDLVPAVLVADCMPIFLFDQGSEAFGVLHSGWKGTGIVTEAVNFLKEKFNSKLNNLYFVIGPHIRECCYNVDKERAEFFRNIEKKSIKFSLKKFFSFSKWRYLLSMAKANKSLIIKTGVPEKNIVDTGFCTKCGKIKELTEKSFLPTSKITEAEKSTFAFGSNRRENSQGDKNYTRMLAYIHWDFINS